MRGHVAVSQLPHYNNKKGISSNWLKFYPINTLQQEMSILDAHKVKTMVLTIEKPKVPTHSVRNFCFYIYEEMVLNRFTAHNEFKGHSNEHRSQFNAFFKLSLLMGANFAIFQTYNETTK